MANPVAIERARGLSRRRAGPLTPSGLLLRLHTWLRRPGLDATIARGLRHSGDPALALREAQLVDVRARERLATRLEELVEASESSRGLSSTAPVDRRALGIAAPVLTDLILVLRSPEALEARGMALGWRLLTDPGSPLYEAEEHGSPEGARLWRESLDVLETLRSA